MTLRTTVAIVFGIVTIAVALLGVMFRLSVKREAPALYESLWRPVGRGAALRLNMIGTYLKMIHLRGYRTVLADYRGPRAWASWLFAGSWLQLAALAVLLLVTVDSAPC